LKVVRSLVEEAQRRAVGRRLRRAIVGSTPWWYLTTLGRAGLRGLGLGQALQPYKSPLGTPRRPCR